MRSAVGHVLAFNVAAPKWADLSGGYDYAIVITNQTAADIVTGTLTFETAVSEEDDPCTPDDATWAPMQILPECDSPPGAAVADATVTFSASNPLPAHSQCQYNVPCPERFVRVSGVPTGADAIAVVTGLRRAGNPGNPANMQ